MADDPATSSRPDQSPTDDSTTTTSTDPSPDENSTDTPPDEDSTDTDSTADADPAPNAGSTTTADAGPEATESDVPADVREYARFSKVDGARYDRVNEFLRERTYVTAREWAIARLCADFRTETGVEMTKIGENLPELVPFMTDTYSPQAVNQARSAFEGKVRKAGATFLYGAMSDFFTADDLDDVMYEATEVAKFLLEVEGIDLGVEEELDAEERISTTMREVRAKSAALRHDEVACPHCGHEFEPGETARVEGSDDDSDGGVGSDSGVGSDAGVGSDGSVGSDGGVK